MEETLKAARLLVELLEDPHPGLFTWTVAVLKTIEKIGTAIAPESAGSYGITVWGRTLAECEVEIQRLKREA